MKVCRFLRQGFGFVVVVIFLICCREEAHNWGERNCSWLTDRAGKGEPQWENTYLYLASL